jgi:PAS domain S-box-containing protein
MQDYEKTREQLLEELVQLRQRVAALQAADQSRRDREDRAPQLLEVVPLGIHGCDTEGRITLVNPAQEAVTGYSADELLGTYVWDRMELVSEKEAAAARLRSLLAEQPVPSPYFSRNVRKNGEVYDARIDWNYRRNSQGQVVGFVSIISDVTEQKRLERELRKSEQRYRMLTESTTDMIFILNRAGDVLYANPSAAAGIRYDADNLVGLRQEQLFPPEKVKKHLENIAGVFETGKVHDEDAMYHFGPDETWLNTGLMPLRDQSGTITAVMGVARNITDRVRAEVALKQAHDELEKQVEQRTAELARANESLRQSEAKYRGLVDICPDSIVVSDLSGKTLFVSKQTWKLLGVPEQEELVGQDTYDYVIEADRPRLMANYADLLKKGKRGETEYTVLRRDGTTVPVELSSVISRDAQGRPMGAMAIIRDVSERKRAEQALQKEHRTLKHLLRSSDHERQLIAYEIHDELAQQLAGALMQIETYWHQKETKPHEAAKAYDAAVTMLRQAHFETRRLISGVRPPILDESGIVAAVAHLVNEQRLQYDLKIEFCGDVSFNRLVPILENAAYRIVQEALANACRYSKSDRVRVEVVQCNNALRIKVQDWGVGFNPAAVRDDHFGLAGIRERARLLGGATIIESAPQRGTSIIVELPLVPREE